MQKKEEVVTFIETIARIHGLPDPSEDSVVLLPSNMGPSFLYDAYMENMTLQNKQVILQKSNS